MGTMKIAMRHIENKAELISMHDLNFSMKPTQSITAVFMPLSAVNNKKVKFVSFSISFTHISTTEGEFVCDSWDHIHAFECRQVHPGFLLGFADAVKRTLTCSRNEPEAVVELLSLFLNEKQKQDFFRPIWKTIEQNRFESWNADSDFRIWTKKFHLPNHAFLLRVLSKMPLLRNVMSFMNTMKCLAD